MGVLQAKKTSPSITVLELRARTYQPNLQGRDRAWGLEVGLDPMANDSTIHAYVIKLQ